MKLGLAPGLQPLWRHLVARGARPGALEWDEGGPTRFHTYRTGVEATRAFLARELDVVGVAVAALPALAHGGSERLSFLLPVTWMRVGMPIACAADAELQSLVDLEGRRLATLPLASSAMFPWRALALARTGRRLEQLAEIVESPSPWLLLESGGVEAAVTTERAWGERRSDPRWRAVTSLFAEWQAATGRARPPIMGGFVARSAWAVAHGEHLARLKLILADGLTELRRDPVKFSSTITAVPGTPPLDAALAEFLLSYWGLAEVDAARLVVTGADREDFARLAGMMVAASCCSAEPAAAAAAMFDHAAP